LGRDFSGVISAVGEGVHDLNVGDAVFGVLEMGQEGAYAEKVAIVAKKPAGLSDVDAAALALTGLTALSAIEAGYLAQSGRVASCGARRLRSASKSLGSPESVAVVGRLAAASFE
jgi:NADPH:quinone reductase-like Zn-dependent oxidoreductase